METVAATRVMPSREPVDTSGRGRLVSNVLITWVGQLAYFVAGFVMPRMIDRKLGQEVLGVWDFSWSLVTYFRFIDMGITSSVNRHVGRYWGKQDIDGINRIVSSATAALAVAGFLILLVTVVVVATLPYLFADKIGDYLVVTQKSVFCLGVMLACASALGGFNGVLTGCHRWELQTFRNVGWYAVSVVGMLIALWSGAGLVTLAVITAVGNIMGNVTLITLAYRACPGLKLRFAYVHWGTIKELYVYAGKTLMPMAGEILLNQTVSILVAGSLGPAALAVFTRPRALLRQMDGLERKMAMILVPTTSSLEGSGQHHQIKNLMIKSVRYSVYLMLPLVVIIAIFGGQIMQLWMGRNYANWALAAILAVGFIGNCVQTPIFSMLSGLNTHGRAGLAQLGGAVISAWSVFMALKVFHCGLAGVAIALTLPLLAVNLIYLPMLLCRRLGENLGVFYKNVAIHPFLYCLPFAICLVIGRSFCSTNLIAVGIMCATGGAMLAILYWKKVLPNRVKNYAFALQKKVTGFWA